ncbi:helix-turn-helix transcriptional regulator [Nocardioides KLBMP 9356]|uniref:Helix-turn-helix transcriptional regulator n=1 Tax=Nocardioides potassii TaxID=2911371 RepID=A0ABS9H995_9ACTN|nr:helix-turn-helix transcriptional regulator [Nocardioides potassii]MCF6376671.1 helix-turn-helix transcriptional regulator [Nocardioides potassii]
MDEPPVAQMLEVATSSAPLLERARGLVESLDGWLPVDDIWMTLSDPDEEVYATAGSPGLHEHVGRPVLAVTLAEPDGHPLGVLHLLFPVADPPSEAVRGHLATLSSVIAEGISPMRSVLASAKIVHAASSGVVLLQNGGTHPFPGMRDDLLSRLPHVVDVARRVLLDGQVYRTFMWPVSDGTPHPPHVRITVLAATDAPRFVLGAVLASDDGHCNNLTARELEVLGLMVDGRSNQQIAEHLVIAARTVATHVEHILHKLDVPTRTHAAVRAEREGCYVPAPPAG